MSILIGLLIILTSVFFDQITKVLAIMFLSDLPGNTFTVIPNFFRFYLTFNKGAAFSSFSGQYNILMILTVIATLIFIYMAKFANFKKAPFYSIGVYLMIGGMLGNLVDRIATMLNVVEGVTDFISFTFFGWDFAVFNLADICLCVGVACVIIDMLFFESKRKREGK